MFLIYILVLYTVPTLYTYFRLKKLFPRSLPKILFISFYLFVALGFFMGEILSHRTTGEGLLKYLILLGFYTLPYLLYLFLSVLIWDILNGINRLVKIIPLETTQTRKFQSVTAWILFFIPAIIVFIGSIHADIIRISEYRVDIPCKSAAINHLKIALAADFHLGETTKEDFLGKAVGRFNALNPDIILLPGDIIEGHHDDGKMKKFAEQFRQINAKYGVYASRGNHESHNNESKLKFFADAGIKVLSDEFVTIADSFHLLGRNDERFNNRKPIEKLLDKMTNDLPIIVLDHRPTNIEAASQAGVDIQLSGHTHNGQLFPLNFIINEMYGLGWKHKKINNTHLFVTSGIYVWGPPVRTAGNSEIMVINVNFKDN